MNRFEHFININKIQCFNLEDQELKQILPNINEFFISKIVNNDLFETNDLYINFIGLYYLFNDYNNYIVKMCFKKALIKFDSSLSLYNLMFYYSLMKKFEKMRSYYLKLCNNHDKYIDISYYLFGSYYYLNNDITNARKWYLNALEINVLSSYVNLAFIEKKLLNFNYAKYYLINAIKYAPSEYIRLDNLLHLGYYYETIEYDYYKAKKLYLEVYKYKNSNSCIYLGNFYKNIKNNETKMIKYYINAALLGNGEGYNLLAKYYTGTNFKLAHKYYLLGCKMKYVPIFYEYAMFHRQYESNSKLMLKYLDIAIKYNNVNAAIYLAKYYGNRDNIDLMKHYYDIAIKLNSIDAAMDLASFYKSYRDYDNMIKYYNIAIKEKNLTALYNLAIHFENSNWNLSEKYYLTCVELNYDNALYKLANLYRIKNNYPIMIKYLEKFINNTGKFIDVIEYLKKHSVELLYANTLCLKYNYKDSIIINESIVLNNKLKYSIMDECPICFEDCSLVYYKCCAHFYCINCIYKIKTCSICGF